MADDAGAVVAIGVGALIIAGIVAYVMMNGSGQNDRGAPGSWQPLAAHMIRFGA